MSNKNDLSFNVFKNESIFNFSAAVNGIPNTGGGGGAGSYWSPNSGAVFASGAGGTGIVVISYPG